MHKIHSNKEIIRDSNIELLRIIAILGVIILHYNNSDIGGGFKYVKENSLNYFFMYLLQSIFACGVDLFVLITGYFMCNNQIRTVIKPINLLLQVILFGVIIRIVEGILNGTFSVKSIIGGALPVNYFVILYIVLYFISPYINIVLKSLNKNLLTNMVIILFIIFSVWPTFVDVFQCVVDKEFNGLSTIGMYGSQWGYSIINFILMYILGGYIRLTERNKDRLKFNSMFLYFTCLMMCVVLIMIWSFWNTRTAWEYCNPLIIFESIIVFKLFNNLRIKSKIINKISRGAFTTFLIHTFFFKFLEIEKFVNKSILILILHITISCILIYLISYLIWCVFDFITKPVFKFLFKNIKSYSVNWEDKDENTVC